MGSEFTCGYFIGGLGLGYRGKYSGLITNQRSSLRGNLMHFPQGSIYYYIGGHATIGCTGDAPKFFGAPKGQTLKTMGGAT